MKAIPLSRYLAWFSLSAFCVLHPVKGLAQTARSWNLAAPGVGNWSTSGNWNPAGPLTAGDSVTFTNTGGKSSNTSANSIVDASISLTSLTYSNSGASLWQNTQISNGQTLTLSSTGGTVFSVGAPTSAALTQVVLSGDGALHINNSTGVIQIGSLNGTSPSSGNLDMSGLANFTSNTASFNIGSLATGNTASVGSTVILAKTSTIIATNLNVGGAVGQAQMQTLKLGSVANTIRANTITVGAGTGGDFRNSGQIVFNDTTGTVRIRAADNISAATMNLVNTASNASATQDATVDFRGHDADVLLSTLTMAKHTNGNGGNTAMFSFDTGTLGITSVVMAEGKTVSATLNLGSTGSTGISSIGSINMANTTVNSSTTTATLNVAGGTHEVTGNITMSTTTVGTSRVATSLINIIGGTLTVDGNIVEGTTASGGTTNTTLTLNGGTLDMTNGNIGTSSNTLNTLNFQSGTLQNVSSINTSAGLTKTTAGTLRLAGTNTWAGATTLSAGTLHAGSDTALGGGTLVLDSGKFSSDSTTARAISNVVTFGGDVTLGDATNTGVLTFNAAGTLTGNRTITTASNVVYANAIGGGANGLTKSGAANLTLGAVNTYTGNTLVSAGTLIVSGGGSIASSATTVNSGATLNVNGIAGVTTVNAGGTLSGAGTLGATSIAGLHTPGNSPGIQNFGSTLDYTNGSSVAWELIGNTDAGRGTNFDGINVGTNLTITGTSTLNLVFNVGSSVVWADTFWDTDREWLFYDVAGTTVGAFTLGSLSADSLGNALGVDRGAFAITYQGSDVYLTYSAIPEPSTTLLLAGALTTLVIFRRRRRI